MKFRQIFLLFRAVCQYALRHIFIPNFRRWFFFLSCCMTGFAFHENTRVSVIYKKKKNKQGKREKEKQYLERVTERMTERAGERNGNSLARGR